MWYGLKRNDEIISVIQSDNIPSLFDFGEYLTINADVVYTIVEVILEESDLARYRMIDRLSREEIIM